MESNGGAFGVSSIAAANVSSVPKRSPLRYPGGKTWLIPHVRAWFTDMDSRPKLLVEPFCGGATVTLTAVAEKLVNHCLMAELDRDVAAFWHAALRHGAELREKVKRLEPTTEAVGAVVDSEPSGVVERGFRTLVLNRMRRGGILAPGAALLRAGEDGRGLSSRWYSDTLIDRLTQISTYAGQITFCEADGMQLLEIFAPREETAIFVDPPYTAGGKRAGSRLYAHHEIDHARLFALLADGQAEFMMTYDPAPEVIALTEQHGFTAVEVTMKNVHHARVPELVITRTPVFEE